MATTQMSRVTSVLTGVGGSPYYFRGYFQATAGDMQQQIAAWHKFVARTDATTSAGLLSGAVITTEGFVPQISPVSGDIVGFLQGEDMVTSGTGVAQILPPSNAVLHRWSTGVYRNGREVKGRTFRSPAYADWQDTTGQLKAITRLDLGDLAQELVDDEPTQLVVWSKKNQEWFPVIGQSVWSQFAVLRSRRD